MVKELKNPLHCGIELDEPRSIWGVPLPPDNWEETVPNAAPVRKPRSRRQQGATLFGLSVTHKGRTTHNNARGRHLNCKDNTEMLSQPGLRMQVATTTLSSSNAAFEQSGYASY